MLLTLRCRRGTPLRLVAPADIPVQLLRAVEVKLLDLDRIIQFQNADLGPRQTRHFDNQCCDKKILLYFDIFSHRSLHAND